MIESETKSVGCLRWKFSLTTVTEERLENRMDKKKVSTTIYYSYCAAYAGDVNKWID